MTSTPPSSLLATTVDELIQSISATDNQANGRRTCTRILNQWKKQLIPHLSQEESLKLLIYHHESSVGDNNDGCGEESKDSIDTSDGDYPAPSAVVVSTLLSVVNNDDDFSTEGHRETSVDILKILFRRAFADIRHQDASSQGTDDDEEEGGEEKSSRLTTIRTTLIKLFHQCSQTFQKRMAYGCQNSNGDSFLRHGTMMEPMEPSEHIRLLLVELMIDLGDYCLLAYLEQNENEPKEETHSNNMMIEATSNLCQNLAKSTFLDPYPEVQRSACTLVERLTRLCPLAVRMNATRLLVPLTGNTGDAVVGGAADHSSSASTLLSKKCLFRHRHAKTRCRAVDASVAIVMCCPREDSNRGNNNGHDCTDDDDDDDNMPRPGTHADHLSSYGSHSTSMERILYDTLLPELEDLLKMDPSASVQIAVLKSLGNVADVLDWRYYPNAASEIVSPSVEVSTTELVIPDGDHNNAHSHKPANTSSTMDLASMVEARVLSLFLMGLSAGNVTQVRSIAVRQLSNLQSGGDEQHPLPRGMLVAYFQPMLELILDSCSPGTWATCQSKVRSLEMLQVLLSISIPLMENENDASVESSSPTDSSPTSGAKVELPNAIIQSIIDGLESTPPANSSPTADFKVEMSKDIIRSIMDGLSKNILSEEKDVLKAALESCRIIGSNNHCCPLIVSAITLKYLCNDGENKSLVKHEYDDATIDLSSPRQMTSMLLILDGMMKGYLCNGAASSILHEIDQELTIQTPDWFHKSPSIATTISSFVCHSTITSNVASNSSLAWALLDACNSFVQCIQQSNRVDGEEWGMSEDVVINILISIAYLLGCPDEFGISSHAMRVLHSFSSCQCCVVRSNSKHHGKGSGGSTADDAMQSLMDVHFRRVLPRIISSAPPFPWEQSDPAFLAIDALLRTCSGSTAGNNFDMVAPFFISHLSTAAYNKNDDCAHDQSLKEKSSKDELADEYSLRISLMALLQTILSDESFSQTLSPQQCELSSASSAFSAQSATDVLLSLVLPNLVWKAGGMASALRKLAAATLFSLLSHYHNKKDTALFLHPETITHLIPILHSNLEDTESTTRELSCVCLTMVLEQVSTETFKSIMETNTRVIDTLYPRLLELLDDSHNPVRIAACQALEVFLTLAHSTGSSSYNLGLSSLENITSSLLIQLDDPDREIQEHAFQVLVVLLELQRNSNDIDNHDKKHGVVEMMNRKINDSLTSHRDGSLCRLLLDKVKSCHE